MDIRNEYRILICKVDNKAVKAFCRPRIAMHGIQNEVAKLFGTSISETENLPPARRTFPKLSPLAELVLAIAVMAVSGACLPVPFSIACIVQSFGFVIVWMIDPRLRGKLVLLVLLSPIVVAIAIGIRLLL